jgi:hypothetical protein
MALWCIAIAPLPVVPDRQGQSPQPYEGTHL